MSRQSQRGDMACPCGNKTRVIDSRAFKAYVRRRRKCLACGARFSTYEYRATTLDAMFTPLVSAIETVDKQIRVFRGEHHGRE